MIQQHSTDEIDKEYQEADYLKRILAGLIDGGLIVALVFSLMKYFPDTTFLIFILFFNVLYIPIVPLLLLALYRLITLFLFNGTLGMKLCKLILLNEDCIPLSKQEKTNAAFFLLINGVRYYDK